MKNSTYSKIICALVLISRNESRTVDSFAIQDPDDSKEKTKENPKEQSGDLVRPDSPSHTPSRTLMMCAVQCLHLALRDSKGERGQLPTKVIRIMCKEGDPPKNGDQGEAAPAADAKPEEKEAAKPKAPSQSEPKVIMVVTEEHCLKETFRLGPDIDSPGAPGSRGPPPYRPCGAQMGRVGER
jgi:hypothetical protein